MSKSEKKQGLVAALALCSPYYLQKYFFVFHFFHHTYTAGCLSSVSGWVACFARTFHEPHSTCSEFYSICLNISQSNTRFMTYANHKPVFDFLSACVGSHSSPQTSAGVKLAGKVKKQQQIKRNEKL